MNEYKLPDVGEGLTEAEIVTWKVKVGDVIKINDIVVEIETAKSLVELPSPYAGTIQALLVPEGETIPVGTPIIRIGDGADPSVGEEGDGGTTPQTESDPYLGLAQKAGTGATSDIDMSNPAATGGGENQTLVGYGPREAAAKRRPRRGGASPA
ncbi:MAG: biotin/lipoyl-containing protein, partial [Nocardioides sp.]